MSNRQEITTTEDKTIEKNRELRTATPSVDIYENENEILLYVDMPGVHKEDVSVNIENGKLSISGVRKLGQQGVSNWADLLMWNMSEAFPSPRPLKWKMSRPNSKMEY
ncbi:Hsp20/alpha crystallin family protein [uncultured Desulfobacter sp.]|uniref:Hsp20/alpha crystallin family protein n=1 Tax=uncultured Desulfobacter sp. TaxID=240139 RepID=UPI002AAB1E89|nr:Hsp20/alpha crystallin family protein [uncultured Desulfobacter sp.]